MRSSNTHIHFYKKMYKTDDYSKLKCMVGFSDKALDIHFALYDGYVKNTNKILDSLKILQEIGKVDSPEYSELKRRFGWEFDGMRLHEFYFSGLGGDGKFNENGKLAEKIKENFGSFENWKKDFVSTAKMRGIGWVILYQDPKSGKLLNFWVNEHDSGHPAGLNLLVNLDLFEHAFLIDYGTDKSSYIEAYFKNINWKEIESRILND